MAKIVQRNGGEKWKRTEKEREKEGRERERKIQ